MSSNVTLTSFNVGDTICAGDTLYGIAERLTRDNEPDGGRKGFKLSFDNGSHLCFKEHNDKTGTWELYIYSSVYSIRQLYNAAGWKVNRNLPYVFQSNLVITAIDTSFGSGSPANEIANFRIQRAC